MTKQARSKSSKKPSRRSALTAAMDHLARRNHSELELRRKLGRVYTETEVDEALAYCNDQNWLCPPDVLSLQTMNALHRRKKGFLFIRRYLKEKGLPIPARIEEVELEKAKQLLEKKFGTDIDYGDFKLKQKMFLHLRSKGFEEDIIRKVIYVHERP